MKFYLHLIVILSLLASCSGGPNGDPVPEPPVLPPVILPDTLSAGWTAAVTPSSTEIFSDIFFADNNTGYLVGGTNAYKSTNGGLTWNKIFSIPSVSAFTHLAAANANRACFVAVNHTAYTTQNAAVTIDSTDYSSSGEFQDAFFSSTSTCYLSSRSGIWKSTDGGANFSFTNNPGGESNFSTLFFLNDDNGFILKPDAIFKTINAGISWTKMKDISIAVPKAIQFLNSNTGFYSDDNYLWKTVDGGANWVKVYEMPAGAPRIFSDIAFMDNNLGYFVDGRKLMKTTDGGAHWEPVIRSGSLLIEIHFTDATHGWACGTNGKVFVFRP